MYPLCVWFTSGTSFVYPNMYPYAFGSPQVPLWFVYPNMYPLCVWFTSGTSFVYPNMYPLCVWFTSGTSFVYPNMYPYAFGKVR